MTSNLKHTAVLALALVMAAPAVLAAQVSEADSVDLLDEAKDLQRRFERFREERIPPVLDQGGGAGCDDIVGRLCLRYGTGEPERDVEPRPEPIELGMARVRFLRDVQDIAAKIPGDRWIIGQQVHYLGEVGRWADAERIALRCGGGERHWWCTALAGYVQHFTGRWVEAEATFEEALAKMPPEEAEDWRAGKMLLRPATYNVFEDAEDKTAMWERLWLLSDPLYLVDGNDRKTENYAREVYVRMKRDAENAFGFEWGDDVEEVRLRWGSPVRWERYKSVRTSASLADNRAMSSLHSNKGRFFLPDAEALAAPSEVVPNSWRIDDPKPWGLYMAPYAPDMVHLETQVARFRRGDSMLVVGAFAEEDPAKRSRASSQRVAIRPAVIDMRADDRVDRAERQKRARNPFAVQEEPEPFMAEEPESAEEQPAISGLILVDEQTGARHEVRGEGPAGTFMLQVPNSRYVMSLEAWNEQDGKAWRDRHGVWQDDLVPGLAALSDIIVLEGGGELPESLDEAVPTAMPVVRIRSGEAFKIAWEVYGLRVGEDALVRIGVDQADEGALRRLGQFLRVIEPDNPIELSFEDAGPDVLGTVFRAVSLNLPDLEPGNYTITVEVQLSGREPMAVSRPLEVVP